MSESSTEHYDASPAEEFSAGADLTKTVQSSVETKPGQSFPLAVAGGLIGSIFAVFLWTLITYTSGYQPLFMPIGTGFIVGLAVRFLGRGKTFFFGLTGAIFSLLGCFLGHFLAMVAVSASTRNTSVFAILLSLLKSGIEVEGEFFAESFSTKELVSYAVAICIGGIISIYKNNNKKIQS